MDRWKSVAVGMFVSVFRVARTFCFSSNGHALHLCSPSEIQKLTISADEWFLLLIICFTSFEIDGLLSY